MLFASMGAGKVLPEKKISCQYVLFYIEILLLVKLHVGDHEAVSYNLNLCFRLEILMLQLDCDFKININLKHGSLQFELGSSSPKNRVKYFF